MVSYVGLQDFSARATRRCGNYLMLQLRDDPHKQPLYLSNDVPVRLVRYQPYQVGNANLQCDSSKKTYEKNECVLIGA